MLASISSQRQIRGKFAQPPVKVACLPCRTLKTRCSGHEPCYSCATKNRKCVYLPSKRGGPRKRGQKCFQIPDKIYQKADHHAIISKREINFRDRVSEKRGREFLLSETSTPRPTSAALGPPESLRNHCLSGYMRFKNGLQLSSHVLEAPPHKSPDWCCVRAYWNDEEILNDYYDIIHPYFPILPPNLYLHNQDRPTHVPAFTSPKPPLGSKISPPLSYAMRALLALYPCPGDFNPASPKSTYQRKNCAQAYAQEAELIADIEYKTQTTAKNDTAAEPNRIIRAGRPSIAPTRQHSSLPEDLELLQAFLFLSAYEYVRKGDLVKMKFRAHQALALALQKSLHCRIDDDRLSEAQRRAWWMTHYAIIQSARSSYTSPTIPIEHPQLTTSYSAIEFGARICIENLRRNALLFEDNDVSNG